MRDLVGHVEQYGVEGTGVRLVGFAEKDVKVFETRFEQEGFGLEGDGMWRKGTKVE